jgi:hypothetical protein
MTAMTRPTLRACPFCGADGEDTILFTRYRVVCSECEYDAGFSVSCIGCGAEVQDEYADEAVALWNGERARGRE